MIQAPAAVAAAAASSSEYSSSFEENTAEEDAAGTAEATNNSGEVEKQDSGGADQGQNENNVLENGGNSGDSVTDSLASKSTTALELARDPARNFVITVSVLKGLFHRQAKTASLDPFKSGFWVFLGSSRKGLAKIDRGVEGFWVSRR